MYIYIYIYVYYSIHTYKYSWWLFLNFVFVIHQSSQCTDIHTKTYRCRTIVRYSIIITTIICIYYIVYAILALERRKKCYSISSVHDIICWVSGICVCVCVSVRDIRPTAFNEDDQGTYVYWTHNRNLAFIFHLSTTEFSTQQNEFCVQDSRAQEHTVCYRYRHTPYVFLGCLSSMNMCARRIGVL